MIWVLHCTTYDVISPWTDLTRSIFSPKFRKGCPLRQPKTRLRAAPPFSRYLRKTLGGRANEVIREKKNHSKTLMILMTLNFDDFGGPNRWPEVEFDNYATIGNFIGCAKPFSDSLQLYVIIPEIMEDFWGNVRFSRNAGKFCFFGPWEGGPNFGLIQHVLCIPCSSSRHAQSYSIYRSSLRRFVFEISARRFDRWLRPPQMRWLTLVGVYCVGPEYYASVKRGPPDISPLIQLITRRKKSSVSLSWYQNLWFWMNRCLLRSGQWP